MKISKSHLRASLEEGLVRHHVPGASIAIFHEGELTTAVAGVVNVNTGVEVTPETVTQIGSITKVFTTTLVMQLVDEGTVELDERVVRYLPDLRLKDREALQQITVKMLLNHTSGIDGEMLPDHGHDEETIEKGIVRYAELGQLFDPGAELSYCNAGMVIAGYLAQRLTGKSWYRLVRERIFEPLQMKNAAALPEEAVLHRVSVGHYLHPATQRLVPTSFVFLPLSLAPAGSTLMMSARDLIAFAMAHMALGVGANGNRILSAHSAKAMQHLTVNNRGKGYTYIDMGLGWMVSDDGLLHHGGGSPGIISMLYAYPERDFAVAILTNADYPLGLSLINELLEPWLKEAGTMRPFGMADMRVPSNLVSLNPDKYAGVYEDLGNRYRVSRTPDGLALSKQVKHAYYENMSIEATPVRPLIPLGDQNFLLESDEKDHGSTPDAFRIFTFRNPDAEGHMQLLGNSLRLYRRLL